MYALVVVDADFGVVGQQVAQFGQAAQILGVVGEAGLHLEQPYAVGEKLADKIGVLGEIRVGDGEAERDLVAHAAAEQVAHRGVERFADDVEQRHFHRCLGLGAVHDRAVGGGEQGLDAEWVGAEQQRAEVDVKRGGRGLR